MGDANLAETATSSTKRSHNKKNTKQANQIGPTPNPVPSKTDREPPADTNTETTEHHPDTAKDPHYRPDHHTETDNAPHHETDHHLDTTPPHLATDPEADTETGEITGTTPPDIDGAIH